MLYCVDISKWQDPKDINYKNLLDHAPFIVCRLAYGSVLDSEVDEHVKNIKANRDPFAFYFYLTATTLERAKTQVAEAVELLDKLMKRQDLHYCRFLAIDIEGAAGKAFENKAADIVLLMAYLSECLERKKIQAYPALYASASRLNKWLKGAAVLQGYFLWVACYMSESDFKKRYPLAYECSSIWQFTSSAYYPCSYAGFLDLNILNYEGGKKIE